MKAKLPLLTMITLVVALLSGCSGDDKLFAQLKSPNVMLRKQAIAAISQSPKERLSRQLALLLHDKAPADRAVAAITELLNDESEEVRLAAIGALGNMGNPLATEPLLGVLRDQSLAVRAKAIEALGKLQARQSVPALVAVIKDGGQDQDERLVLTAIWSLGNIGDPAACTPLSRLLSSDNAYVRYNAAQALKKLK